MKIGIVTLTEGYNYGCKLQNYALLSTIKKMSPGDEVLTIKNDTCCGNTFFSQMKKNVKLLIRGLPIYKLDKKKRDIFVSFNENYLSLSHKLMTNKNVDIDFNDIDIWVCGSDQIWNPHYIPNISINSAKNARPTSIKVSYAASLGVKDIPESRKKEFADCVDGLNAIAVREEDSYNALIKLIDRKINLVLDPTLLLSEKEWADFEERPKNTPLRYVLTYFLKGMSDSTRKSVEKYAQERKLQVVELNNYEAPEWFAVSPNEFVYLIHHSDMFFTDSFHGTAFSIIFKKQFVVMNRNSEAKEQKQNGRIETLLNLAGLESQFACEKEIGQINRADYETPFSRLEVAKQDSLNYLKKAISSPKYVNPSANECSGCGACLVSCPTKAINMRKDKMGFEYPFVDISKCISCGKCSSVCAYCKKHVANNISDKKAYAVENEDEEIRINSSSGGVFQLLAKTIIESGGVVFSPLYDKNFNLSHVLIDKNEDIDKVLGSKYTQSDSHSMFIICKSLLEEGRLVLFTGTPCQIHGLKNYLGKDYANLYTQDLICHGCSSPALLSRYLLELENKYGSSIEKMFFRDKTFGWNNYSIRILFSDGKELIQRAKENHYFLLFLRNYGLRQSCYSCIYRKEERASDITLADFWNIESSDDKGTSLVILNSSKGVQLFCRIKDECQRAQEVSVEEALIANTAYNHDIQKPKNISEFIEDFHNNTRLLYKRYVYKNPFQKVVRKMLELVR